MVSMRMKVKVKNISPSYSQIPKVLNIKPVPPEGELLLLLLLQE